MKALVVGAREGSLGEAIAESLGVQGMDVVTSGISGEDRAMDILVKSDVRRVLKRVEPNLLVCTAGINRRADFLGDDDFDHELVWHLTTNAAGVLMLLREFVNRPMCARQFVAVSSNSAHIARGGSAPYCASKAALSMGLRVAARECKGSPVIWGVEPGYVDGTPMSAETKFNFAGALHRIPGVNDRAGLGRNEIANHIVALALNGMSGMALNGCMIRLDGGEQ